ncbi:ribbon-helix-helix protein, CopG family [bacterium]|nr:ribbon-helix-helix protein, CopG family [bacterium]
MNSVITVRLDKSLQKRLESISKNTGVSRSDIIRDALKRQLSILAFEKHREMAMPFAEAHGFLTDEDVFKEVS